MLKLSATLMQLSRQLHVCQEAGAMGIAAYETDCSAKLWTMQSRRCGFKPCRADSPTDCHGPSFWMGTGACTPTFPCGAAAATGAEQAVGRVLGSLCVVTASDGDAQSAMLASWISQASGRASE